MLLVLFLIFLLIFLLKSKITIKSFNNNYLSLDETHCINGLFILIVFFSHFRQYIVIDNQFDSLLYKVIVAIGQMMVTTFLFYSGYGIYESIKSKKDYLKKFFKRRFLPTYLNFLFAVTLFLILNLVMHSNISLQQILLSYIGWDSLGNSNWYMFDIFLVYIIVILVGMMNKKGIKQIVVITVLTILSAIILSFFKEGYWVNTLLCFPAGMWYSYFKDKIDKIMSNKIWVLSVIVLTILILLFKFTNHYLQNAVFYNMISIAFVLLLILMTKKVETKSKIFVWAGKNLFWIYILERLPMIIFKDKFNNPVFFLICFVVTILSTICIGKVSIIIKQKVGRL